MIDCAHYRRAMLSNPHDSDLELRLHRDGCPECFRYTERLLRFESRFERALRVGAPQAVPAVVLLKKAADVRVGPQRPAVPHKRFPGVNGAWLAMAASVLIVLTAVAGLWLASPARSLAADVVAHMAGEPQAWARTDVAVPPVELAEVLKNSHMRLRPDAPMVSYARSCAFRGRHVPHLVVQTDMGPITVMVLVHESVRNQVPFDEEGYRGVILPVPGHGSLAVLTHGRSTDLDAVRRVAARVQNTIDWTG